MPKLGLGLSLPTTRVAGGFTPKKISGLSLWLDAAKGITKTGGDEITLWADQSGNGLYASPWDVPPLWIDIDSRFNNLPSVLLSEVGVAEDRSMEFAPSPMGEFGTTAFVVNSVDPNVEDTDANGALLGNFGGASDGCHWPYGLSNSVYDSFCSDTRKDDLGLPDNIYTNANLYCVSSQDNDWNLFYNGTLFASDNTNVYSNANGNGDPLFIGKQTNAGTPQIFKGRIAEIVVYNRVLTTQERQQVEAYLNAKYAIY